MCAASHPVSRPARTHRRRAYTRHLGLGEGRGDGGLEHGVLLRGRHREGARRVLLLVDEGGLLEDVAKLAARRVHVRVGPAGPEVLAEAAEGHACAAVARRALVLQVRADEARGRGLDPARFGVDEGRPAHRTDAVRRARGLGDVVLEAAPTEDVAARAARVDGGLEHLRADGAGEPVVEGDGEHLRARLRAPPRQERELRAPRRVARRVLRVRVLDRPPRRLLVRLQGGAPPGLGDEVLVRVARRDLGGRVVRLPQGFRRLPEFFVQLRDVRLDLGGGRGLVVVVVVGEVPAAVRPPLAPRREALGVLRLRPLEQLVLRGGGERLVVLVPGQALEHLDALAPLLRALLVLLLRFGERRLLVGLLGLVLLLRCYGDPVAHIFVTGESSWLRAIRSSPSPSGGDEAGTRRSGSQTTESAELDSSIHQGGVCTASGVGGTPACGAGWYILREVNGLPQPSHPRRAQNQGAYPAPSMVTRFAGADLYAAAARA